MSVGVTPLTGRHPTDYRLHTAFWSGCSKRNARLSSSASPMSFEERNCYEHHRMDHHRRLGLVKNIVTGIVGALIGGFVMSFFGAAGFTGFNLWSFLVALIGSIILIAVINLLTGKRA